MFTGFEHPAIAAADPENLASWYCNLFGFRIVYDNGKNPPIYLLKTPDGSMLEILPAENGQPSDYEPRQIGFRHLAITVTDFPRALEYLKEKDLQFFDLRDTFDGGKLVFFRDPEGNLLHLMWRPQPLD